MSTLAKLRLAACIVLAMAVHGRAQVLGGSAAPAAASSAPAQTTQTTTLPATTTTQNPTSQNTTSAKSSDTKTTDDSGDHKVASVLRDTQTEFQQMVATTTGRVLPIFGLNLFNNPPSTFAPGNDVNVGPSYIIGPGDELQLQLSGQINQQLTLTVDRTGAVSVPGIGPVHVAGLPFGQLDTSLRAAIGKIYRNFDLSVNLGALRTIQVFVVGQATSPGSYSISSLSTLLNALLASGGPTAQGSLRDIQVKRGGQTIAHFDVYDLLLHGDKSHDVSLATGDVIFIPTVGPQVAVTGSVSVPAIYELKGETTVGQLLALAGGPTNVAAGATVRLERIYEHTMRSVEDVALATGASVTLQNGDILSVASITERFKDAVTLRGNVANPGRYVWHPGMRVSDLIPDKAALITRDYWRKRNALGQQFIDYAGPQQDTQGNLNTHGGNVQTGGARDTNQSSGTSNAGGNSVAGALTPGNGTFSPRTDLVLSAPDINWDRAVVERLDAKTLTTTLLPFNLGKVILDGDPSENLELLPGDVVTIFSKADVRGPSLEQTRFVRLEGEFTGAAVYSVLPGETLRGLLKRAGGLTGEAYLYGSEFTRESTRRLEQQRYREYADQLEAQNSEESARAQARAIGPSDQAAAAASSANAAAAVARLRSVQPIGRIVLHMKPDSVGIDSIPDLPLEDGDRFIVPRVPSTVNVEGQVYSANAFIFTPGRRVIDYLRDAGGPDRQADRKRMFVLRADGSVVSRQYANVEHTILYPGDTIVVPPQLDKRAGYQRILDIATIVGQFTLGAATVAILSR